jgi:hypothetical protein
MSLRAKRGNLIAAPQDCFGWLRQPRNDRGKCHSERSKERRFVIWISDFVWHLDFDICDLTGMAL